MKNTQEEVNNQQVIDQNVSKEKHQENITISVPNPQIYISKAQNHIKNTKLIQKFLQKTLKSQIIFVFLLIFFIIDIIIAFSNIKIRQENKKLNEDNLAMYEMIEITNIGGMIEGSQVNYLENLLSQNGIYLDPLYYIDFVDAAYDKYDETIKEFKRIDLNKYLDAYLNRDYNDQLYNKRINEE